MTVGRERWIADREGVAHGHEPRATRTICGKSAIDPRFEWPRVRLCPECVGEIERRSAATSAVT